MKIELLPRHVGDITPFSVATCDHLEKPGVRELSSTTFGEVFKDGQLAWLANGSSLEIVSTSTGERHATWEFGIKNSDTPITITCVTEFKENRGCKLIIGSDNGSTGGFISLFCVNTSKILRVISVPQKVTSLEVISTIGGVNPRNFLLCQELRYMYGIVAAGMQDGNIFLLDLMLDDFCYSDLSNPSQLAFFTKQTHNIPNKREDALTRSRHLTLHLNDGCQLRDRFQFRTPTNDICLSLLAEDVFVSALLCARPNGCLIAGFSFGGFQIWDLNKLQLTHTTNCDIECPSVIKLAFQEPDNDPRNFCYVWVVRGQSMNEMKQEELTTASLYSLSFEEKIYIEGFGQCYRELISCVLRFDFELNNDPMQASSNDTVASRLINCKTIDEVVAHHQGDHSHLGNLSVREEGNGCSLCLFVWESTLVDPNVRPRATLAIFDLNQWYQAQMPSKLKYVNLKMCPFFGFYSMSSVSEKALPDFVMDVCVPSQTIRRMQANFKVEQFFYPSSLAFDSISLFDTGVIHAPFLGLQRQILLDLKRIGPSLLANPKEAFKLCMCGSLLPLHGEPQNSNLSLNSQRESLLSMALEYGMVEFLISCIKSWATGQFTIEGCTLRFMQDWAWKKVYQIKTSLDKQCVPLFDCSGIHLDSSTVQSLYHQASQLKNLEFIFQTLLDQCHNIPTTDHGAKELENRGNVISLLILYLEVILWFLNFGLLPENDEDDSTGVAYPCRLLGSIYSKRREEIQRLCSTIGPKDLLIIDGLISHVDDSLPALWEKDGGDGLYPPPCLHALLSSYLLHNISSTVKHQIVQYLFLDMAELLNSNQDVSIVEHFVKFPAAFSLSPSIIKLTQGFWLLDHKIFEEAISVLLHPIVSATDVLPWQHVRVMKAFLYQGEAKKALTYARVRRPNMQTADDVRFHLTLLLANGLVAEAYHYQKSVRNQDNEEDLLNHFFMGCQQTKNIRDLLNLPLSLLEETHLVDFLHKCPESQAREILVIYYLQRSRYVDAMRLNDRLMPRVMHEADPAARERTTTRNAIVDGFSKLMPRVYGQITQSARHLYGPGKDVWQQVPRPQPLSTKTIAHSKEPISQSTFIEIVMGQITDVWAKPPTDYTPYKKRPTNSTSHMPHAVPLIGTPVSTKRKQTDDDLSTLVFPTVMNRHADALDQSLYQASPAKKSRYYDVSPMHLSQSNKRRSLTYYNSEALSLLQTPPVRRKTSTSKLAAANSSTPIFTPQSILKVNLSTKYTPLPVSEQVQDHDEFAPHLALTPEILDGEKTPSLIESKDEEEKSDSRHLRFQFSPTSNDESRSVNDSFMEEQITPVHEPFITEPLIETKAVPKNISLPADESVQDEGVEGIHASPRRPLYAEKIAAPANDGLPEMADVPSQKKSVTSSSSSNSSQSTEAFDLDQDDRMIVDDDSAEDSLSFSTEQHGENEYSSDVSTDENPACTTENRPHKSKSTAVLQVRGESLDVVVQEISSASSTSEEVSRHTFGQGKQPGTPLLSKERGPEVAISSLDPGGQSATKKTPSPRPMSFFSAERGKEHFKQMKSAMSKELAKQSGSSDFDFINADIEIVETESPLASLVNKTLDSVFSTKSNLPAILQKKLNLPSNAAQSTASIAASPLDIAQNEALKIPLSIEVQESASTSFQPASMASQVQNSPRTRRQAALEKEALITGSHSPEIISRKSPSLSPKAPTSLSPKSPSSSSPKAPLPSPKAPLPSPKAPLPSPKAHSKLSPKASSVSFAVEIGMKIADSVTERKGIDWEMLIESSYVPPPSPKVSPRIRTRSGQEETADLPRSESNTGQARAEDVSQTRSSLRQERAEDAPRTRSSSEQERADVPRTRNSSGQSKPENMPRTRSSLAQAIVEDVPRTRNSSGHSIAEDAPQTPGKAVQARTEDVYQIRSSTAQATEERVPQIPSSSGQARAEHLQRVMRNSEQTKTEHAPRTQSSSGQSGAEDVLQSGISSELAKTEAVPRTRNISGQAGPKQTKSPSLKETEIDEDMETVFTPSLIRTRSQSGQKNDGASTSKVSAKPSTKPASIKKSPLRTKVSSPPSKTSFTSISAKPTKETKHESPPKAASKKERTGKEMDRILEPSNTDKSVSKKTIPSISDESQLVETPDLTSYANVKTPEKSVSQEKQFNLRSGIKTSVIMHKASQEVSKVEDKDSKLVDSKESQTATVVEVEVSTGTRQKRASRRHVIRTTFINDDETEIPDNYAEHTKLRERKPRFSFSHPTIIEPEENDHLLMLTPTTPVTNFIFSPPLTRSKSRKVGKLTKDGSPVGTKRNEGRQTRTSPLFTESTKSPKKSSRGRRPSILPASETPINFISPALLESTGGESSGRLDRRSLAASRRHTMTLRKSKDVWVSRKSARLE